MQELKESGKSPYEYQYEYVRPSIEIVNIQQSPTLLCASIGLCSDEADDEYDQL